jgi:hypothetical protein
MGLMMPLNEESRYPNVIPPSEYGRASSMFEDRLRAPLLVYT